MDDFERIADAHALEEIRKTEGFYALVRLMMKKKDDIFRDWAQDKDLSKEFCRGVLTVVDSFESDIDQEIEYGRLLKQQEEESMQLARGRALEGGGTGDLAL